MFYGADCYGRLSWIGYQQMVGECGKVLTWQLTELVNLSDRIGKVIK